jgi:molybdate/tungstate transport system substrate-binding protein
MAIFPSQRIKLILFAVLALLIVFSISVNGRNTISYAQQTQQNKGKVFVMYAASLGKTFEQTLGEIANMIIDGQRKPDVFVSAGTIPIMKLMNNAGGSNQQQQRPFAQWLVKFASAEMVIAYSPNSHFHLDLDKAKNGQMPWYQILSQPGFKFGRTDPELDPKGYYMIIAAKLANIYYNNQNIKQKILGQDDRNPKQIFPEETLTTNLETGQLDAIAAYKHEAIAKGLPYITLSSQINLGNPAFSDFYKKASYTLSTGKTVYGEPIYFSITIPDVKVSNLNGVVSFVTYLLSADGEHILQSQGLNFIKPTAEGKVDSIPIPIRNITMARAAV